MIHNLTTMFPEDASVLWQHYFLKKEIAGVKKDEIDHRVQVAAIRMIAYFGMFCGGVWATSILTFVITIPLKIALKLALAVSCYIIGFDFIKMANNAWHTPELKNEATLWQRLTRKAPPSQDAAHKLTNGTLLQPLWLLAYANRHKVNEILNQQGNQP